MSNSVRVLLAVIFFAVMAGVRQVAHFVVDLGFIPWLLLMIGIFWIGFKIDNHDRRLAGESPWSAYEAGQGVRAYFREPTPYILAGLLAFAYLINRFT